ncbi:MAG TPA: sulfatase-like hydrolase/transferase [Thermoanaerobaculia bacterium]|nr:sulfatase-like hydrolase/transferase [Thermoanaerobaculia bacterium]
MIIISIDTLRADHLPAYGYKGVETPAIDALRKDAILYANAYSHVPLTLPSHVSLLTGQLPPDNGVRNNIGFPFDAAKHPTIASLLKQNGYATGAAVSAYVLRGNTGLANAFDFYDDRVAVRSGQVLGRLQRPGTESAQAAEQWIASQGDKPFFFLLHLFEPHSPYDPPEPFKTRYASLPYDGEIAAADVIVGQFIDDLKKKNIYDRAVIVLLSDHGEGLHDHGEDEHGIFLYREAIHVPLILKLPKSQRAGESVSAPVQLIDVLPTIAALTGITAPAGLKGASLLAPPASRNIYSETLYPRIHLGWSDLRSLAGDTFHYIDAPRPELYAASDVAEKSNVLEDNRRVYAAMRKELEPFPREMPVIGNIDPEEAKKLAALGYLSSTSSQSNGPLPDPKDHIDELSAIMRATQLEKEGRYAESAALLRDTIAKNPRLTDAWTLLAKVLEEMGRYEEAIETYKRGIQIAPSIAGEFSLSLANLYLMTNHPDEAIQHAAVGASVNPGNAHIITGRAAMTKGDLESAAREAQAAMDTFNYRAPGMVLLAEVLVRQRRLPEAATLIDQALQEARDKSVEVPPLLFYVRGDILARMNQIPAAIDSFNEEIRRFPHDRQAYANLAVIYILSGRRADANATMERLVRANPDRSSYDIAWKTFAEMQQNELAAQWRRRAR